MATTLETWATDMLTPVQEPGDARPDAVAWGPSLTINSGQAVGRKTTDQKVYPLNNTAGTNEVQTLTFGAAATGGTLRLNVPKADGTIVTTGAITWDTTDATYLTNINTALDTATGVTGGIVATGAAPDTALTLTFSGTGFAGKTHANVSVHTFPTSTTTANVVKTTTGGTSDGTQVFAGFSMYTFKTDSAGKVYYGDTAAAGYRTAPESTSPIWKSGTFDPQDLRTATPVAEVNTFTPSNPTTADVYTQTITFPDLTTLAISATVGATQTATATVTLHKAAWAANATAAAYAVPTGTTTLILTSAVPGNTMNIVGTVVGTGTMAKVLTTPTAGRSIADLTPSCPGARVLHNGFWLIPG